jgi:hypothetical protein
VIRRLTGEITVAITENIRPGDNGLIILASFETGFLAGGKLPAEG